MKSTFLALRKATKKMVQTDTELENNFESIFNYFLQKSLTMNKNKKICPFLSTHFKG
ncbi:hypothetical protein JBKA6_1349 [Ichthyobacterium seriolicida]|uniref:Uncharacterized protein n=1 Tax=Ichthyobacterium seriolicida TaxID=242600 RepID=A0A1J1DZL3_9FLAO|nr:hypothetical protein JBKA6_1349 [Ichthyobacterium seriolicida]